MVAVGSFVPAAHADSSESVIGDSGQVDTDFAVTLFVSPSESEADFTQLQPAADRALALAAEGQSVRLLIGAGLYRESVELAGTPDLEYAPIAIVAREAGRAVICGSKVVNGWKVGDSGYFEKVFTPRAESVVAVYVQSVRLERVRADRALRGGQFRIVGDEVQFVPPANATVVDGVVEVAYEPKQPLLGIYHLGHVRIAGLYLRQGGGEGVRVQMCDTVDVRDSTSEHQYISGYHFEDLHDLRLFNTDALRNGKEGIDIVNVGTVNVIGGTASNNGYRAAERLMKAGDAFGLVVNTTRKLTMRNFQAADNQGTGIGVFYAEALTMRRSKSLNNGGGLNLYRVGKSTLQEAVIAANRHAGLLVMESECAASWSVFAENASAGAGAQVVATDDSEISLAHCIIAGAVPQAPLLEIESLETVADARGNLYWGSEQPFAATAGANGKGQSFAVWQAASGQDLDSAWGDPKFNYPANFEYIPLGSSIWYQQKSWPTRTLSEDDVATARAAFASEEANAPSSN